MAAPWQIGGNALSIATHSGLAAVNADTAIMAGYMGMSIPIIAYSMVSVGGMALSSFATQVGSVAQSAASQASSAATTGNISLGNLGAYNTNMFHYDTAPSTKYGSGTFDSGSGVRQHMNAQGQWVDMEGGMPVQAQLAGAVRSAVNTQASESITAAKQQVAEYGHQVGADYQNMQRLNSYAGHEVAAGHQYSHGDKADFSASLAKTEQLAKDWDTDRKYSTSQKAQMLAAASVVAQNPKLLDLVSPVSLKGEMKITDASDAQFAEDFKSAVKYAEQTNFGEAWRGTQEAGERLAADFGDRTGATMARDIAGGVRKGISESERTTASLSTAEQWQQAKQHTDEQSASVNADLTQQLYDYVAHKNGPEFGQQAADMLFAKAKDGDAVAMQRLVTLANDYAHDNAAKLAGVTEAPERQPVVAEGQKDLTEIRHKRGSVEHAAVHDYGQKPAKAAQLQGIKDRTDVEAAAKGIAIDASNERGDIGTNIVPPTGGGALAGNVDGHIENGQWMGRQILDAGKNSVIPKAAGDLYRAGKNTLTGEYHPPEGTNAEWRDGLTGDGLGQSPAHGGQVPDGGPSTPSGAGKPSVHADVPDVPSGSALPQSGSENHPDVPAIPRSEGGSSTPAGADTGTGQHGNEPSVHADTGRTELRFPLS